MLSTVKHACLPDILPTHLTDLSAVTQEGNIDTMPSDSQVCVKWYKTGMRRKTQRNWRIGSRKFYCGVTETVVPGEVRSGLNLPSDVGPMDEKYARLSNLAAHRGIFSQSRPKSIRLPFVLPTSAI